MFPLPQSILSSPNFGMRMTRPDDSENSFDPVNKSTTIEVRRKSMDQLFQSFKYASMFPWVSSQYPDNQSSTSLWFADWHQKVPSTQFIASIVSHEDNRHNTVIIVPPPVKPSPVSSYEVTQRQFGDVLMIISTPSFHYRLEVRRAQSQ